MVMNEGMNIARFELVSFCLCSCFINFFPTDFFGLGFIEYYIWYILQEDLSCIWYILYPSLSLHLFMGKKHLKLLLSFHINLLFVRAPAHSKIAIKIFHP